MRNMIPLVGFLGMMIFSILFGLANIQLLEQQRNTSEALKTGEKLLEIIHTYENIVAEYKRMCR